MKLDGSGVKSQADSGRTIYNVGLYSFREFNVVGNVEKKKNLIAFDWVFYLHSQVSHYYSHTLLQTIRQQTEHGFDLSHQSRYLKVLGSSTFGPCSNIVVKPPTKLIQFGEC